MELSILDVNLMPVGILDIFDSLIWTDRYYGYGDFEITASPGTQIVNNINSGPYLSLAESEHDMIIENININSGGQDGNKVIVKGRSLESILDRRIIWNKTVLTGNFQDAIHQLLNENAITPTIVDRDITRLVFEASVDPIITVLTIDTQLKGENLYDAILSLCQANNIGFKITLSDTLMFVFKLYAGADRSSGQIIYPEVIFSPALENLVNASYSADDTFLKTVTLVEGKGDGDDLVRIAVPAFGAGADLARREMFTDATSLTDTISEDILTDTQYLADLAAKGATRLAQMTQLGLEDLAKNTSQQVFDGQVNSDVLYNFGTDFFMGDIVQITDDYGHEAEARIIELIRSQDIAGVKIYPTFSTFVLD